MTNWSRHKKSVLFIWLMPLSVYFSSVSQVHPQAKIPRVVLFYPGATSYLAPLKESFLSGLKEVGLTIGTDVVIDYRGGEGQIDRYPEIAKDIVALTPDVIVTASTPAIEAVMRETKKIPIVMAAAGDPVGSGLVSSLARPGGNVTGLSMRSPEVSGKRLELMRDILPRARRIVIFWNPTNHSHPPTVADTRAAARALHFELQPIAIQKLSDIEPAFKNLLARKADGFTLIRDSFILTNRQQFVDFAAQNKIFAIYDGREFAMAGGLISYTPNHLDLYRRAGIYVDKILRGANPANLPVEQTMRAELIINLKAAKQIGLTIPAGVLSLADQVIE
jgi:putative tryptophan/tyrosine transport system substrate-binding protein